MSRQWFALFPKLNRLQKESLVLLQIGTFLEYFDLMLYIHMALLLNDIFFPSFDGRTASVLSAFAFCSTWLLRPIGAIFFGWLGDHVGRKSTIIISTTCMAISCLVMANLPTYAQIGIAASWGVTICRMMQGLSSMGEVIGAQIYLTEITRPPSRYPIVSTISFVTTVGSMAALGLSSLCIAHGFSWRIAFWAGAGIAIIGAFARFRLQESPEFVSARQLFKENASTNTSRPFASYLAYFFMSCSCPFFFYLSYIYCGDLLRSEFHLDALQVINQNFILATLELFILAFLIFLSIHLHPIRILKWYSYSGLLIVLCMPALISMATTPNGIFLAQLLCIIFGPSTIPADGFLCAHMPVLKRFTSIGTLYALSRAIMCTVTTFGLVYLSEWFYFKSIWVIGFPVMIGYFWAVRYFEKTIKVETYAQNQAAQAAYEAASC